MTNFTVDGIDYSNNEGETTLRALKFTNSSSLTHLDLPATITNGSITYSVTSLGEDVAAGGFTQANTTLVSITFPRTIVTFYKFTFRSTYIREFDLTNTKIVSLPQQFAHFSQGYLLKLPYTCTELINDSFNLLQSNDTVSTYNNPTPLKLTLPASITSIDGTPFHHTGYSNGNSFNAWGGRQRETTRMGIRLGELIMYDASQNYYKYVAPIPYDILWGTTDSSGTDRRMTLNNIILQFNDNKTDDKIWSLINPVISSVNAEPIAKRKFFINSYTNGGTFSMNRALYTKTLKNTVDTDEEAMNKQFYGKKNRDASSVIHRRKLLHLGRTINPTTNVEKVETNDIRQAKQRVRNSGYVFHPQKNIPL